jgi:hypothetical protein
MSASLKPLTLEEFLTWERSQELSAIYAAA